MLKGKNKKGLTGQIFAILIMLLVLIFIVIFAYAGSLVLPILVPTLQDATSTIQLSVQSANNENLTNAVEHSFVPLSNSLNNLEWLSYTLIIVMFITFLIMCFFVRTYPFLIIFWIVFVIILLIVSVYLAVVYQDLRVDPTLGGYYTAWEDTDFILRNLPVIVFMMGLIGGIIMFTQASKDPEREVNGGEIAL